MTSSATNYNNYQNIGGQTNWQTAGTESKQKVKTAIPGFDSPYQDSLVKSDGPEKPPNTYNRISSNPRLPPPQDEGQLSSPNGNGNGNGPQTNGTTDNAHFTFIDETTWQYNHLISNGTISKSEIGQFFRALHDPHAKVSKSVREKADRVVKTANKEVKKQNPTASKQSLSPDQYHESVTNAREDGFFTSLNQSSDDGTIDSEQKKPLVGAFFHPELASPSTLKLLNQILAPVDQNIQTELGATPEDLGSNSTQFDNEVSGTYNNNFATSTSSFDSANQATNGKLGQFAKANGLTNDQALGHATYLHYHPDAQFPGSKELKPIVNVLNQKAAAPLQKEYGFPSDWQPKPNSYQYDTVNWKTYNLNIKTGMSPDVARANVINKSSLPLNWNPTQPVKKGNFVPCLCQESIDNALQLATESQTVMVNVYNELFSGKTADTTPEAGAPPKGTGVQSNATISGGSSSHGTNQSGNGGIVKVKIPQGPGAHPGVVSYGYFIKEVGLMLDQLTTTIFATEGADSNSSKVASKASSDASISQINIQQNAQNQAEAQQKKVENSSKGQFEKVMNNPAMKWALCAISIVVCCLTCQPELIPLIVAFMVLNTDPSLVGVKGSSLMSVGMTDLNKALTSSLADLPGIKGNPQALAAVTALIEMVVLIAATYVAVWTDPMMAMTVMPEAMPQFFGECAKTFTNDPSAQQKVAMVLGIAFAVAILVAMIATMFFGNEAGVEEAAMVDLPVLEDTTEVMASGAEVTEDTSATAETTSTTAETTSDVGEDTSTGSKDVTDDSNVDENAKIEGESSSPSKVSDESQVEETSSTGKKIANKIMEELKKLIKFLRKAMKEYEKLMNKASDALDEGYDTASIGGKAARKTGKLGISFLRGLPQNFPILTVGALQGTAAIVNGQAELVTSHNDKILGNIAKIQANADAIISILEGVRKTIEASLKELEKALPSLGEWVNEVNTLQMKKYSDMQLALHGKF